MKSAQGREGSQGLKVTGDLGVAKVYRSERCQSSEGLKVTGDLGVGKI